MVFVQSKAVYFCCGNCPKAYISKNFKKGAGSEKKEKKTKELLALSIPILKSRTAA